MEGDDSQVEAGVPFDGEYLARYEVRIVSKLNEIREWRTEEFEAGRLSSLADYCRAYGLCPHCYGVGIALREDGKGRKVVGLDGETRLYARCDACNATGDLSTI
jgi:hypothetical protein